MCGISGIYNFSNKPVNLGPAIEKIVKLQHHRGPDDQGIWQSKCKKVFFGHNRLTIIDLSKNGSQPFISKDENYIYDRKNFLRETFFLNKDYLCKLSI